MRWRWGLPGRTFLVAPLLCLAPHLALAPDPDAGGEGGGCTAADETSRLRCELDGARMLIGRQRLVIEEKEAVIAGMEAQLAREDSQDKGASLAHSNALIQEPERLAVSLGRRRSQAESWQPSEQSPRAPAPSAWSEERAEDLGLDVWQRSRRSQDLVKEAAPAQESRRTTASVVARRVRAQLRHAPSTGSPTTLAHTARREQRGHPDPWSRGHVGRHVADKGGYERHSRTRKHLVKRDRHGRLLATTDLPTIIAALPTNTTSISLPSSGLTGTLSADWGRLIHLESLDLSGNGITGTVPADLGRLTHLNSIDLSGNQLTGTIPPDLGNLAHLTKMYLYDNQLTGTIPPELGNLAQLSELYLYNNKLTGTLPAELGRLVQLTSLILLYNGITGTLPAELGNLAQLWAMHLQQNQLTGTVPPELGKLAQLTWLGLEGNQLSGSLPAELGSLSQLQSLTLFDNRLTGTIPPELGSLVQLSVVQLYNNRLNGTIPPELCKRTRLTVLDLSANLLAGTVPTSLGKLEQMITLKLGSNRLAGTIPRNLGNLPQLTELNLGGNRLTGTVPPDLGNLAQLTTLDLSSNRLTGTLPEELGSLAILETFNLAGNDLSGTLPEAIGQLRALLVLDVSDNPQLTGTFPDTSNTQLAKILASNCSFTSAGAVGGATQTLRFANNNLTDLPAAWVDLPGVLELDLGNNQISGWRLYGVLPSFAFQPNSAACGVTPTERRLNWPVIQSVRVSGNPFGRSITTRDFIWSFAYLTTLAELYAAGCHLQGAVPLDISGSFGVDMEDTGPTECTRFPDMPAGFRALLTLDLSDNNITAIRPPPPPRLSLADLHGNPLSELSAAWYGTPSSLAVWGTSVLRADVAPPWREGGCPAGGAPTLEANPFGFLTDPGEDAFQCTTLCAGVKTRYHHDASLNTSSLCRCTVGRQGAATNCSGCPPDTYSNAEDEWAMVRVCRPCPERSSTGLVENATSVEQCKCPAGWYMETPLAAGQGAANASATPACVRCKQGWFMDTLPGATQEAQCTCNASYDGLRALRGACGCADNLYMDNVARACRRCDAVAEECIWGSSIELSLLPPVVKASYWAAPPPELGPDQASDFSRHDIWRCFNKGTCPGHGACAAGRSGAACSLCAAGMYGGPAGPCHPCPYGPGDSQKALLYGLLVGPAAAIAAHAVLHRNADLRGLGLAFKLASLGTSGKQVLKYLQMLGVIAAFNIDWPPLALQFFTEVSHITVALPQVAGVACLTGQQTATLEMGFRWLMPVAGLLSACLGALVLALVRCLVGRFRSSKVLQMSYWDVLRVSLWGLVLFYSTLLQFGTQMLACTPSPNGVRTVVTFPHLRCGDSGEWARLAAISVAFLLAFVGAVFLGIYAAWRRASRALVESNFTSSGWWGFLFGDYRGGWGHWVMLTSAKDAALVLIATAGASDGPSQLLATAALCTVYSYVVLRDQPFQHPSNSFLEAWTVMSVAVLSIFSAGMGFQSPPDIGDVAGLYLDGAADPEYKKRERALLAVQCLTFLGPAGVMLYQLLCASDRVRNKLPACLRPPTQEERARWNREFLRSLRLDEAAAADLSGVLDRFDVVDGASFRDLMSNSTATLGVVPSNAGGLNIKRLVRKRSERYKAASASSGSLAAPRANDNHPAPAAEVLDAPAAAPPNNAEDGGHPGDAAVARTETNVVDLDAFAVGAQGAHAREGADQAPASKQTGGPEAMMLRADGQLGKVVCL